MERDNRKEQNIEIKANLPQEISLTEGEKSLVRKAKSVIGKHLVRMVLISSAVLVGSGVTNKENSRSAEAQNPQANYRALILYEEGCSPGYKNDAEKLYSALVGGGWTSSRIKVEPIADTLDGIKAQMKQAYDPDNNNNIDLKLFYYSGHGGHRPDEAPLDEPGGAQARDEDIELKPTEGGEFFYLTDDELATAWSGFSGKKVLIYDSCFSGGMIDGIKDPKPADSYIMMSCQDSETSGEYIFKMPPYNTRVRYSQFTAYLREGLGGSADTSNPKDADITFTEAFTYADNHSGYTNQNPFSLSIGAAPSDEIMINVPAQEIQIGVPDEQTRYAKCAGDSCPINGNCGCPTEAFGVGGIAEEPDLNSLPQNTSSQKSKDNAIAVAAGVAASVIGATGALVYINRRRFS